MRKGRHSSLGYLSQMAYAKKLQSRVRFAGGGSLAELLSGFLGHVNFSILSVTTVGHANQIINEKEAIEFYRCEKKGAIATIRERKGLDGDGRNNFRGDGLSWNLVLEKFVEEERIGL